MAPSDRPSPARNALVEYVKRGRDAGLSLVLATQQPSALDDRILSQVNLSFSHRLTFQRDISAAADRIPTKRIKSMTLSGTKLGDFGDMLRVLDSGAVFLGGSRYKPGYLGAGPAEGKRRMAATTRTDPYAIFMRKVGYTVGLERTLERVTDLERAYVTNRDLTWADWRALVHEAEHWNLQSDHIGAVFRVMGFVQRTAGELFVLDNLDAMAIACELAATESERERIRRFIFLWALLLSDGELFVNMLLAEFDEARIGEFMRKVLTHKRRVLRERLPDPGSARRVARVVRIARQVGNPGSKGKQDLRSGGTRTEPLEAEFRRKLARAGSVEIPVLAFFRGLFSKGAATPQRLGTFTRAVERRSRFDGTG